MWVDVAGSLANRIHKYLVYYTKVLYIPVYFLDLLILGVGFFLLLHCDIDFVARATDAIFWSGPIYSFVFVGGDLFWHFFLCSSKLYF